MMLSWALRLLCLSAGAELSAVSRTPTHITLECSAWGCLPSLDGFVGMYVYKDGEEVLYYNNEPHPDQQIVPQQERYVQRLQKKGCLQDNVIIISNATAADSGRYSCVYVSFPRRDVVCRVQQVHVSEEEPVPSAELPGSSELEAANRSCPSLTSIIIITSAVSVLFTLIFILLMILMVKRWTGRGQGRGRGQAAAAAAEPAVANEYVYEVMTKRGLRPVSGSSPRA